MTADSGEGGGLLECVRRAAAEYGARTGVHPRVEASPSGTVRAYGPSSSPLGRAVDGLADVRELSYTAAEHHPFWPLLYHAADVAEAVLERWEGGGRLGSEEIAEMRWSLGVMGDALDRLAAHGGDGGKEGRAEGGRGGPGAHAAPRPEKNGAGGAVTRSSCTRP